MRSTLLYALFFSVYSLIPLPVYAGGIEYTGNGAQSLSRGGAVVARANDPMVLDRNPAGLAELRGAQFLTDLNLAIFNACVDPIGYYGWGVYRGGQPFELIDPDTGEVQRLDLGSPAEIGPAEEAYYVDPLDTVCLDNSLLPVPQFVFAWRLSERVGIGAGLIFPSVQPFGSWGGENSVIRGDDGTLRPSPVRYMLMRSTLFGLFPTLGAGVRIIDEILLGLAVQLGMVGIDYTLMAVAGGGTAPHNDIVAEIHGEDYFVPSFTVSTHIVPIDALDFVVAFKWQDKFSSDGGELDLTTGLFFPGMVPHDIKDLKVNSITQGMPWKLSGGVRFADRLSPRPSGTGSEEADDALGGPIHDPLTDERWDIELDVEYQFSSLVEAQDVDIPLGQYVEFRYIDGNQEVARADIPSFQLVKNWQDQISIRLGGTVNVLRSLLGISAGVHYESRGIDPKFMWVDFWPMERVGVHAGFTVRVTKNTDLTFSYAHIFQETIVVAPPPHGERDEGEFDKRVGAQTGSRDEELKVLSEEPVKDPDATAAYPQLITMRSPADPAWISNSGTYRSYFNVIAAGINLHF